MSRALRRRGGEGGGLKTINVAGTPKSVGRRIVTSTGTASASDFSRIENSGLFIVTCGPPGSGTIDAIGRHAEMAGARLIWRS